MLNQVEFEKRRAASLKALGMKNRSITIKNIDLVELLLERDPGEKIVLTFQPKPLLYRLDK